MINEAKLFKCFFVLAIEVETNGVVVIGRDHNVTKEIY